MASNKIHSLVQWNPINMDSQTCHGILVGPCVLHTPVFLIQRQNEAKTETKAKEMRLG